MPLFIDAASGTTIWGGEAHKTADASLRLPPTPDECLRIALVNNMPDAALEDTENQFLHLLHAACNGSPVSLKLFSVPSVPRGERGQERLEERYFDIRELWGNRF